MAVHPPFPRPAVEVVRPAGLGPGDRRPPLPRGVLPRPLLESAVEPGPTLLFPAAVGRGRAPEPGPSLALSVHRQPPRTTGARPWQPLARTVAAPPPAAPAASSLTPFEEKRLLRRVEEEVAGSLKKNFRRVSPLNHLGRGDVGRLAERVHDTLARRLLEEGERRGLTRS